MNKTIKFLSKCSILAFAMVTCAAFSATTARPTVASTTARPKVTGGATTTRLPTTTTAKTNATTTTPTVAQTVAEPEPTPEPEPVIIVDNKTSQFDEVLSDIAGIAPDTSSSDLAERVRQQRALLDSAGNQTSAPTSSGTTGANACDMGLRKCMSEKCGNDFTKCANDSTTIWGDKMDSCRRTTKCTGHEYTLLAPEILADRDMNVRMAYYNSVLNCGNKYNSCIFNECGKQLEKCLSKSDGDRAISKCESIARDCREQDSGLTARVMSAFGGLRTVATANVQKQEQRLYELRDLMRAQCNRLGAMFDERTLDCVYTVNFFAGDDTETPKASKKLYAGDSFQCNANWFGVDVTTFKENAYRLTRSQTGASAAALGAGVGTAAGLVSSNALGRALDTQSAKKAADAAAAAAAQQQNDNNGSESGQQPKPTGSAPAESDPSGTATGSNTSGSNGGSEAHTGGGTNPVSKDNCSSYDNNIKECVYPCSYNAATGKCTTNPGYKSQPKSQAQQKQNKKKTEQQGQDTKNKTPTTFDECSAFNSFDLCQEHIDICEWTASTCVSKPTTYPPSQTTPKPSEISKPKSTAPATTLNSNLPAIDDMFDDDFNKDFKAFLNGNFDSDKWLTQKTQDRYNKFKANYQPNTNDIQLFLYDQSGNIPNGSISMTCGDNFTHNSIGGYFNEWIIIGEGKTYDKTITCYITSDLYKTVDISIEDLLKMNPAKVVLQNK